MNRTHWHVTLTCIALVATMTTAVRAASADPPTATPPAASVAPPAAPAAEPAPTTPGTTSPAPLEKLVQAALDKARAEGAATAGKRAAEEKQSETRGDLDALKNGTLMSSGLTGGVALALQLDGPFNRELASQDRPKATTMPYLLVLPVMWGTPQAVREYCVSSWGAGDESTAVSAANAVVQRRAKLLFAGIESALAVHSDASDEKTINAIVEEVDGTDYGGPSAVRAVLSYRKMPPGNPKDAFKSDVVQWMGSIQWKPTWNARCWTKRIGAWIGYPVAYDARTSVKNADKSDPGKTATRSITPILAFGLGFSPNSYFSVLGGFTVGSVTRDATSTSAAVDETIWATTIAFGGNLDILQSIWKKN